MRYKGVYSTLTYEYCGGGKQWRTRGRVGHAPRGAGFGGASAHFLQSFKNVFLAEI